MLDSDRIRKEAVEGARAVRQAQLKSMEAARVEKVVVACNGGRPGCGYQLQAEKARARPNSIGAAGLPQTDWIPCTAQHLRRVRQRLRLSQRAFANRFGLALGTIKDIEQCRAGASRSFQLLLAVIDLDPELAARAACSSNVVSHAVSRARA